MHESIPFFDWIFRYISVIVPVLLAIFGGLFWLFDRYKVSITTSLADSAKHYELENAKLWAEVRSLLAMQAKHTSDIAVLDVEQRNTWRQLEEIKKMVEYTNTKLDKMLTEVRQQRER